LELYRNFLLGCKEPLQTALGDALKWLEGNQEATTAGHDEQRSAVEEITAPIVSKARSAEPSAKDPAGCSEDPSKGSEPKIGIKEAPGEAQ
jgi:hypothetical protein